MLKINDLKVGDYISLHYITSYNDYRFVGQITRIDLDYDTIFIDGIKYQNDKLSIIEVWAMDYVFLHSCKLITEKQYQEVEKCHREEIITDAVREFLKNI